MEPKILNNDVDYLLNCFISDLEEHQDNHAKILSAYTTYVKSYTRMISTALINGEKSRAEHFDVNIDAMEKLLGDHIINLKNINVTA